MKALKPMELKCFLIVQALCLFVAVLFIISRNLLLPISGSGSLLQSACCGGLLLFLLLGIAVQFFVRKNVERNLLRVLGLYSFITILIIPFLFIR